MENEKQVRVRFEPDCVEVREQEGSESRVITGRAIVFGRETILWDGKRTRVREIIEPSCVTPEFLATQDVKLNALHDRQNTVARNNKGVGTLQISVREDGVYFSAEMPKCDIGDRILALVRNKTYTGCSFEFWSGDYNEERTTLADGREDVLYRHIKFKSLDALTIALDPAYQGTSVSEREQYAQLDADAVKREADSKRKADEQLLREQREIEYQRRRAHRRHIDETFNY